MSENETQRPRRRRPRARQDYKHHKSAVSVTVYDPRGKTIPADVRDAISESVWAVAQQHGLLINIATT